FTAYTRLRAARKSFARAVRRIELGRSGAAATTPELFAHERGRPVPAEARRRALERGRALLPTLSRLPPPPAGGPAAKVATLALAGAAPVVAAGGVALARRRAGRRVAVGGGAAPA